MCSLKRRRKPIQSRWITLLSITLSYPAMDSAATRIDYRQIIETFPFTATSHEYWWIGSWNSKDSIATYLPRVFVTGWLLDPLSQKRSVADPGGDVFHRPDPQVPALLVLLQLHLRRWVQTVAGAQLLQEAPRRCHGSQCRRLLLLLGSCGSCSRCQLLLLLCGGLGGGGGGRGGGQ